MGNKNFLEMRECDSCEKQTLETEQSSCVTSHIDTEDYPFLIYPCRNDEFYCDQCLNEFGFCNKCAENTSVKNQKNIHLILQNR